MIDFFLFFGSIEKQSLIADGRKALR